jgi:hypothetical protein
MSNRQLRSRKGGEAAGDDDFSQHAQAWDYDEGQSQEVAEQDQIIRSGEISGVVEIEQSAGPSTDLDDLQIEKSGAVMTQDSRADLLVILETVRKGGRRTKGTGEEAGGD